MEILVTHIIMKICDNRMKEYIQILKEGMKWDGIETYN